jgi:hypothetical protein
VSKPDPGSATNDAFTRFGCSPERRIVGVYGITEGPISAVTIAREIRIGHVISVLTHAHGESEKLVLTLSEVLRAETERHIVEESFANIESRMYGCHVECLRSDGVRLWSYEVPFRIDSWIIDVESFISQASSEREDGFLARDRFGIALYLGVSDIGV